METCFKQVQDPSSDCPVPPLEFRLPSHLRGADILHLKPHSALEFWLDLLPCLLRAGRQRQADIEQSVFLTRPLNVLRFLVLNLPKVEKTVQGRKC
jgi:hypothetical protein